MSKTNYNLPKISQDIRSANSPNEDLSVCTFKPTDFDFTSQQEDSVSKNNSVIGLTERGEGNRSTTA
jgi:hypothetical protein